MSACREVVLGILLLVAVKPSLATEPLLLVGNYDAARMSSIKPLTFPRVMLYDQKGTLVDRTAWPSELAGLKGKAGDAIAVFPTWPHRLVRESRRLTASRCTWRWVTQ